MNGDFQNPQQDPGSERRLLLVFALTFIVLIISQQLLTRYMKPPAPAPEAKPTAPVAPPQAVTPPPPPAAAKGAKPAKPAAPVKKQAAAEQETVVENDLYKITFTNRGAQVKSWILKKYQDQPGGKPLELVHQQAAAQYGYPLSLWTYDEALRKKLAEALYAASASGTLRAPADISFEYADGDTVVRKSFRFDHSYVLKVETSVTQNGQPVRAYPAWPAGFGDQQSAPAYAASRVDIYQGETDWHGGEKVTRLELKKISGGSTISGPFQWGAVTGQYFGAAFLPDDPQNAALVTLRHPVDIPKDPAKPEGEKIKMDVLGAAAGNQSGVTAERIFAGPMNLTVLQSVKATPPPGQEPHDLAGMVDFGTYLGFIAKPLFLWLRWTHAHMVANWGWAIIVLTVVINLVLFPLRLASMKSAMKMQKLQPQINAIKQKYSAKTRNLQMRDPKKIELNQQQNQEIAALFKREGANPVGGCVPMLIQFPFLVAFYSMLGSAIELRHANWLWLKDLSAPEPGLLHWLPLLVIVSMVMTQRLTPQAGMDPTQQKMMNVMMPLMLGFISWNLSSGLCLYWVASNVIAIVQQLWMNQTSFGREMRAEAAKRAARKKE